MNYFILWNAKEPLHTLLAPTSALLGAVCQFHLKNEPFHRKMEFSQKKEVQRYLMCITETLKCLFRKFVGVKI